jgi:hypothetical protein
MMQLKRHIRRDEQALYIEVPFQVPARAKKISVSYAYESLGEGDCVVDLGLRDESKVRGWSGGARSSIFVSDTRSTPGYLPGVPGEGEWAILLGAYRIPEEGCIVTMQIDIEESEARWLKGDLHMHSVHSDGTYSLEDHVRILSELGCDFAAFTDHNTVSQNFAMPRDHALILMPGMEWTTNFGHANFIGVAEPIADFRALSSEEAYAKLREAKRSGASVVLNHPHCPSCPWEWGFDVEHDWVEIWNGPWREGNQRTLDWWHMQLCGGRRLVAVGGSDVHRPHPYVKHAMPTTWVYSQEMTARAIREGIDQGHVAISFSPEGPTIELACDGAMIGDTVHIEAPEAKDAVLSVKGLKRGDRITLISSLDEAGWIYEQSDGTFTHNWHPRSDALFYRAEVWRRFDEADGPLLAAISNPIYISAG